MQIVHFMGLLKVQILQIEAVQEVCMGYGNELGHKLLRALHTNIKTLNLAQ